MDRLDAGPPADAGDADVFDAGDADVGDGGADAEVTQGCEPNLNPDSESCPEICPEACNGQDDDCDGTIDESNVDRSCAAPHAQTQCLAGQCLVTQCLGGFRDCDEQPLTGCEIAPTDVDHCGGCGRICRIAEAAPTCLEGSCVIGSCNAGWADCDGDRLSCEVRTNTLTNCAGCGVACTNVPNASPSCASGSCGVDLCNAGFGNCDGMPATGCEQPLDTLAHCGGCDIVCPKASCNGGVCTAADCSQVPGSADCDKDEASCEVDLRADVNNCGACGNQCQFMDGVSTPNASLGCTATGCVAVCDAGFGDCDGNYRNGCEQPLNTLTHCGLCGMACSIANAAVSCATGSCRVQTCNPDYADCDADTLSCETRLNAPDHCGTCATVCNLPNAIEGCGGSVGARVCTVAGCDGSWADCDAASANGCERDARPVVSGGVGPCLPDSTCTLGVNAGREYYACSNLRSWADARSRCQLQARGDLAQINDSAEDNYVRSRISVSAFIGHNDSAREGLWVWANNRVPFWQGSPLAGQYNNWAPGEPNASGNCGVLYTNGQFDDNVCSSTLPYVCEVGPDACPSDSAKIDPGQCGCGVADTDTDSDGFANCNESCPNDPNKRVVGICGCGVADTDSDGDGTANCNDGCPNDAAKTTAGICGCGVSEVDTDGDGARDCSESCDTDPNKTTGGLCGCGVADTDSDHDGSPNCLDGCPADPTVTSACFPFAQSNITTTAIDFSTTPDAPLNCSGTTTINTANTGAAMFTNWCGGTTPTPIIQTQSGGPDLVVIPLKSLTVPSGLTLRLIGTRPVAFAVRGNVTIAGIIDANASTNTPGAGGNWSCGGSKGGDGGGSAALARGGGGGGGGAFGTAGARGGRGDNATNYGAASAARNTTAIKPLYGGCNGGYGGGCSASSTPGGAGGGAVQITASGSLTVTGTIRANGGVGDNGCTTQGGGAGGGSGGAVLLESSGNVTTGATITANGGKGGNGTGLSNASGGNGSSSASAAGSAGGDESGAGGGGGGGFGRIRK